jgi:hypothetical protein
MTAPVPYRQPFANPARNSAEENASIASKAPSWSPVYTAQSSYVKAIDWLLGGGPRHDVLLFDAGTGHAWLVDLQAARATVLAGTAQGSFPAYQEDNDQLVLPRDGILVLPEMTAPGDPDRARQVDAGGLSTPLHALIARRDHFTAMSVVLPNQRERHLTVNVISKPYSNDARPQIRWEQYLKDWTTAPSPALSDDTLVACREGGLSFFAADGAGFVDPAIGITQAKVIAEVQANLRPGLVSADVLDRVWGFRVEDGALIGWDARGQSLGPAIALEVSAVQPPVALPGGAIAVIAAGVLLKIADAKVQWRAELPPSAQPLATADRDGKLLVRAGKQLVLIDDDGKRVWSSELPAEITSNPLITRSGRLCVAAGLTLYCSPP